MDTVALDLALATGRQRTAVHAGITMGSALLGIERPTGISVLEDCVARAKREHFDGEVAHALGILGFHYTDVYELERGRAILQEMLDFTAEHDLDCWRRWAAIGMSRLGLAAGDFARAAEFATMAIHIQSGCFLNRMHGHLSIARVRARRGDPEVDDAIAAAVESRGKASFPSIDLALALTQVEAAYLAGDDRRTIELAPPALAEAIEHGMSWIAGQLAHVLLRLGAGLPDHYEPVGPYELERAGAWREASAAWQAAGAPYEAACALSMLDEESALREAFATFERLGAKPMAARVAQRLRDLGIVSLPRGPRTSTKQHPFGLTAREADVLALLVEGCTNAEIAERLFLSPRTVEHHVTAILTKLDVKTRRDAIRAVRATAGESMPVAGA
jgi:DNA-binding CsgD family transcriptional regulator